MRILQVTDSFKPVIGGLERHVETLAQEQARRGHHVAVATLSRAAHPGGEADGAPAVYRLEGWSRILGPFYASPERRLHPTSPDPGLMQQLRRVIAHEHPHIIHAHGWIVYSLLPLMPG